MPRSPSQVHHQTEEDLRQIDLKRKEKSRKNIHPHLLAIYYNVSKKIKLLHVMNKIKEHLFEVPNLKKILL